MVNHIQRKVQNIHFTNCQFHNNADGLVIGPDLIYATENKELIIDNDGKAVVTQTFHWENISFTNCSFANHAWNMVFQTLGEEPQQTGSVTNFRVIGCSFQQGKGSFPLPGCGEDSTLTPSSDIQIGGNGCIVGCDFVGSENPDNNLPQIRFNSPWSAATWRVIGNHFEASRNKVAAIEINGEKPGLTGILRSTSKVRTIATIVGNHFESVTNDNPPPDRAKHPFVFLQNSDPSLHMIHSNIGDGQVQLEIERTFEAEDGSGRLITDPRLSEFSWIDVSPGIPITLGSAFTKGRNELVTTGIISKIIDFSAHTDLNPPIPGAGPTPTQVDYQVEVTFQWDAGSWWITDKKSSEFTINWTNKAPENALLDWTLHL